MLGIMWERMMTPGQDPLDKASQRKLLSVVDIEAHWEEEPAIWRCGGPLLTTEKTASVDMLRWAWQEDQWGGREAACQEMRGLGWGSIKGGLGPGRPGLRGSGLDNAGDSKLLEGFEQESDLIWFMVALWDTGRSGRREPSWWARLFSPSPVESWVGRKSSD